MNEKNENIYSNNPYPGIRSYTLKESHLFFGREEQIFDLTQILNNNHFVAITGSSGSGKSSIVKAGIIPKFINNNPNADFIVFRPGNNPIKNLSESLLELFDETTIERNDLKKIVAQLNKSDNALTEVLSKVANKNSFLIYIDQFEELFRYRSNDLITKSEELSELFIKNIINAVKNKQTTVFVVLSLRSDFLSECSIFEGLPELINKGNYLLPNMTTQQKEQAIRKPAETMGVGFTSELLELFREQIQDKNLSLPVLQHALMRTWNNWLSNAPVGSPIGVEHYQAIGTVSKALSFHAEDIYVSLTEKQKKLTEKIFRALTYWGDDERVTRSPQKLSDLCLIANATEIEVIEVLNKFRDEGNSFITPPISVSLTHNSIIDITHESIMIYWERLLEWVKNETKSAQLYIRLSKSAELYQAGKTGVLVNPDLQIALNWLANDNPNLAWATRYDVGFERVVNYIKFSKKEYEKSIAAEIANRERNLKRARLIAIILGIASIVSILLTIIALNLRYKALQSEMEAVIKQRIAEKESYIAEQRRKESYTLQIIAKQQKDIAEQNRLLAEEQKKFAIEQQKEALFQKQLAILAKNDAIESRDLAKKLQLEAEFLRDEAIDQKKIIEKEKLRAELSEAQTDTLRRLAISKTLAIQAIRQYYDNQKNVFINDEEKFLPHTLVLQAFYFNKKNKGNELDPDIFNALLIISNSSFDIKSSFTSSVRAIKIFDNERFFAASSDGKILLLNVFNKENPITLNTQYSSKPDFRTFAISPNNQFVASGSKDGTIFLWRDKFFDQKPSFFNQSKGIINGLLFVSESEIVAADNLGTIALYNIKDNALYKIKSIQIAEKIVALEFYNNKIFVATESGLIYSFTPILENISKFKTENEKISTIKCSDQLIFVAFSNGLIEMITYEGKTLKRWFAHNTAITQILLFNSKHIITSSYDKTIKIWNFLDVNVQPVKLEIHNSWVHSIVVSNDNKYLISADASGGIKCTTIDINEMKNKILSKINKNMNETNWNKYIGKDIEYSPQLPNDL